MALRNRTAGGPKYWRVMITCLLVAGIAVGGYIGFTVAHHNFHVVTRGQLYRSGQMSKEALSECVREYGIRSILNLRGSNEAKDWYRTEMETAKSLHVEHYDIVLASSEEVSVQKMGKIAELLRDAPKPLLIHCESGADRSGLVAAIYRYKIEGEGAGGAENELTVWYGHIPLIYPKVKAMDRSFQSFVSNNAFQAGTTNGQAIR